MKHGARNDMIGEVIEVDKSGGIMGKATVRISGEFELSSVMTKDSIESMNLKTGDRVHVLVKAVNVLLIKDE
jgi:molybdate transport system regulatory protein